MQARSLKLISVVPVIPGWRFRKESNMIRQWLSLIAVATIIVPLAATPVMAQTSQGAPSTANDCPPGTRFMPPGRDGAGNPTLAYCAAAPTQGTNDPYTGRNAPDPQANPTSGPGQSIPQTR